MNFDMLMEKNMQELEKLRGFFKEIISIVNNCVYLF